MTPVSRSNTMRTFYVLGSLSLFNVFYCASIDSKNTSENGSGLFNKVPDPVILEIAKYLNNPFPNIGSLDHYTRNLFATIPVKPIFKNLFPDIPELISDDVEDFEPELRIILPLAKFPYSDHIYEALKYEIINGNTFNVLLPNLMKYFDRVGTIESNRYVVGVLMDRKRFDVMFQNDAFIFNKYADIILKSDSPYQIQRFKGLFEYIMVNPQHFVHIKKAQGSYNAPSCFYDSWNKLVLISNAPVEFFINYHRFNACTFDIELNVWYGLVIPEKFFTKIFEKINNDLIGSKSRSEYYRILNRIRFGPDDPNLFENELQNNSQLLDKYNYQFIKCASLANKMDLFYKLLSNLSSKHRKDFCRYFVASSDDPIELHKVIFDIHNSKYYRGINDSVLLNHVFKYYKVTSINVIGMKLEVELTLSTALNKDYPVPQKINLKPSLHWYDIYSILNVLEFETVGVLEAFLLWYFEILKSYPYQSSDIYISAANLKIIAQSESTCQLIRTILAEFPEDRPHPKFVIYFDLLPNVLDEPVVPMADIVRVENTKNTDGLIYLNTFEKLKRLEIMTGQPVSSLVNPKDIKNYFKYRHVFNYLIQTGQKIPQGIDWSVLEILRIDFPNDMVKLNKKRRIEVEVEEKESR